MNISLLKRRYNSYIISFILLSSVVGGQAYASPACPIITNQFQAANGATVDNSATGWSADASALTTPHPTGFYFAVKSNRFTATNLGGVGIVTSKVFSIQGYQSPQVSVKITSEGNPNSNEYVEFYYKLDGGSPVLVARQTGSVPSLTFTSPVLSGNNVQLIVKLYNYNNGSGANSNYYIERYDVFQTKGPCTPGNPTITVTPTGTNGGVLTCSNTSTTLSATPSSGVSYFWTGPNNFSTTSATPTVSVTGTYTLIVTAPTTPVTWGTRTFTVTTNTTPPANVGITGNTVLACSNASTTLTGSSGTTGATFTWTGPNSFRATGAAVTIAVPGTYTVTATHPATGCTATASVVVTQTNTAPTGLGASNTGPLTCSATSVYLQATANPGSGVSFAWTGPNGFTASGTNIPTSIPGTYTLTATNTTTGCAATTTTIVTQNSTPPEGVTATNTGPLTCSTTSVNLQGASTSSGVTFNWTGPNGFTASGTSLSTSIPGTYTLTVTNASGCTTTASTIVTQTATPPEGVTITPANGSTVLTCANNFIGLTGSSSTPGVSYSWTGPDNFTGNAISTTVFNPGVYTLTVSNGTGGCASTASITITQNIAAPVAVASTPSAASLTCANPNVTLTASSATAGVTYSWASSNGFSASGVTANVGAAGTYILTATDPTNGCTTSTAATITQDFTPPAGIIAINNGPLTCAKPIVLLTGYSSTPGVTYRWTGPNSFTDTTATPSVSTPGTYTLKVTNPVNGGNGCSATANTIVARDTTSPTGLLISSLPAVPQLTCTNTSVSLTASSSLPGTNFSWTGPNSFTSAAAAISIGVPGVYTVTATNTATGCTSSLATHVIQNITPPANLSTLSNPLTATLTCATNSIDLTASSDVAGANYSWSGPNSFTGNTATATVTDPGTYTVTATDPANGCTSTANAIITQNITAPAGLKSIPATGQITCINPTVVLTGSATTTGVSYSWTGPNNYTAAGAAATITVSGVYTVKATDPTNGCTSTATGIVTRNINAPSGVTASSSDVISCFTPSVFVTGTSTTSGATFSWTGPDGFTATTASAETDIPGNYTLVVTNPANGCTTTVPTSVVSNTTPPGGVTATNSGPLNCINTSVTLTGASTTPGAIYTWVAPNNSLIQGATASVSVPGAYTLVVTDQGNGCASTASTTVAQNTTGCMGSSAQVRGSMPGAAAALDTNSTQSLAGAAGFVYKAWPNPFSDQAFIEFQSPESSLVTVEIYNNLGIREKILFNSTVVAHQSYKLELDKGNLSAGIHFCIIRSQGKVYTTKLILLKQ